MPGPHARARVHTRADTHTEKHTVPPFVIPALLHTRTSPRAEGSGATDAHLPDSCPLPPAAPAGRALPPETPQAAAGGCSSVPDLGSRPHGGMFWFKLPGIVFRAGTASRSIASWPPKRTQSPAPTPLVPGAHVLDLAEDDVHVGDGHVPAVDHLAVPAQLGPVLAMHLLPGGPGVPVHRKPPEGLLQGAELRARGGRPLAGTLRLQ